MHVRALNHPADRRPTTENKYTEKGLLGYKLAAAWRPITTMSYVRCAMYTRMSQLLSCTNWRGRGFYLTWAARRCMHQEENSGRDRRPCASDIPARYSIDLHACIWTSGIKRGRMHAHAWPFRASASSLVARHACMHTKWPLHSLRATVHSSSLTCFLVNHPIVDPCLASRLSPPLRRRRRRFGRFDRFDRACHRPLWAAIPPRRA